MPNSLAYLALIAWPAVSAVFFARMTPGRALITSLVVGYLLLPPQPAGIDLPLLPPLTKETIPSLAALVLALIHAPQRTSLVPEGRVGRVLVAVFVLSPVVTALTNSEPVGWGTFHLPGLGLRDMLAMIVQQSILIMPFLLGRALLAEADSQRDILMAFFVGGLVYSLPMLVEIRLSPQINIWVYGYFQHVFEQMMRGDGFRPLVFLYHGLWAAFFAMTSVVAAVALARAETSRRSVALWGAALYLFAVLVLCKSLASLLYAVALVPLVAVAGAKIQIRLAALLACLAIAYPVLKGTQLVPEDRLLAAARAVDDDRAASLEFRFAQERILLERAEMKPLFGWGSWGRNHEHDSRTGAILTVTDGRWVILIGIHGWIGFLAEFGLLALPILTLARRSWGADPDQLPPFTAPLVLLLGINLADLIPNATITPLTWMMAGAVLGFAERWQPARRSVLSPVRTVL
ncbi:hypothetical protein [Wenxinia marina]|uniref:O-antigen ligase like membrane protein n=1 Tax=Wenxinia marina DSM 24838 TaxID=1123501 RepID=A0A0D0QF10_9RHOB|nr:hypothetical protein [Wenxinia marina]KIQ70917.1 O-antigen ligase like membrane protein [Wenxinia marina DSM 24838]GGL56292.1 hypothetical protein GCM10011392_08450 [Wenxinia marina]